MVLSINGKGGISQGRFLSFGQRGASWQAKQAKKNFHPPVNVQHPPAGGC